MKPKVLFYIICFILGGIAGAYITRMIYQNEPERTAVTHSLIVEKMESMGNLEIMKYSIQDVMEYKKTREWLPNAQTVLLVQGEVVVCIDLSEMTEDKVTTSGDSIALLLPPPAICHVKIDHSQSKVYDTKYGLWESAQLVDEAYKHAQRELELRAEQINMTDEARKNATLLLTPMLNAMGFGRVTIVFDDAVLREYNN